MKEGEWSKGERRGNKERENDIYSLNSTFNCLWDQKPVEADQKMLEFPYKISAYYSRCLSKENTGLKLSFP